MTVTSRNTRRPVTVIASDICHMTVEAVSTTHVGAGLGPCDSDCCVRDGHLMCGAV